MGKYIASCLEIKNLHLIDLSMLIRLKSKYLIAYDPISGISVFRCTTSKLVGLMSLGPVNNGTRQWDQPNLT